MGAAKDIATIIADATDFTIGTDLFYGRSLTDTPDTQIATATYGSFPPDLAMTSTVGSAITERPRVQVVSRALAYDTAEANAQSAWNALQNYKGTVNGTNYLFTTCLQSPFFMGLDDNNRVKVGFNVEAVFAS